MIGSPFWRVTHDLDRGGAITDIRFLHGCEGNALTAPITTRVNVASDAGRVGSSGEAVYAACKGGLIAFTKTLARELARKGVTLNVVCPGPTDTPLFDGFQASSPAGTKIGEAMARAIPLKRIGQPDDYAGMIAFLLSDESAYMTGQTISVSGGLTMV